MITRTEIWTAGVHHIYVVVPYPANNHDDMDLREKLTATNELSNVDEKVVGKLQLVGG